MPDNAAATDTQMMPVRIHGRLFIVGPT